jgi:hypothetical protein
MFDIKKSKKSYIQSNEHFIVVRNELVFLRIVGEEGRYHIITATADEDNLAIRAYPHQQALNDSALKTSERLGALPKIKYDYHNRPYIEIAQCEYISDAHRAAELFFEILPEFSENQLDNNLENLYQELSIDDSGDDLYLSDGVWLSSDGTLKDVGR